MDSKVNGEKESRHLQSVSGSVETERKNISHHKQVLDAEAAEQLNVAERDLSAGAAEQLNVAERDLTAGLASASSTMKASLPIDGVCNDVDFFDAVTCMLGYPVKIYTQTGDIYRGVISTFSPQFEFALELSSNIESNNSIKKAIFHSNDIANVEIVDSDLDFEIGTFNMDSGIGKLQELKRERVLEWDCCESAASKTDDNDDDDLERATTSEGWGTDEIIKLNEEEFGVATGLNSEESIYTTPLKNKDSKVDNVAEERAKKITFEHEKHAVGNQKSHRNHEHDVEEEEEKFAAEARSLKPKHVTKDSAYSVLKKSVQQPKVVVTAPSPIIQPTGQLSPEISSIENQSIPSQQLPKNLQVKLPKYVSVKNQQSQQQQTLNEQGQEKRQHCLSQRPHLSVDLSSKPRKSSPDPWKENTHQQVPLRARFNNQPPQMHRMPQRIFHPRSFHSPFFRARNVYGMPPPFAQLNKPRDRASNDDSFDSIPSNFHASRNPRMSGTPHQTQGHIHRSTPVYRTGYLTPVSESAYTYGNCCPNASRCSSVRDNIFTVNGQQIYAYGPIGRACTPMHKFYTTGSQLHARPGYQPFNCPTMSRNMGNQWSMLENDGPPRRCFHTPGVHPSIARAHNHFNQ